MWKEAHKLEAELLKCLFSKGPSRSELAGRCCRMKPHAANTLQAVLFDRPGRLAVCRYLTWTGSPCECGEWISQQ
ncbi:hypothetical protein SRHO_G00136850 [Serrasalmus rhombeus]